MPTPKLFATYPEEYKDLFFGARQRRVVIPFDDPAEAKRLRARLYAYRTALADQPELAPELALIAPAAKFAIEAGDLVIYFEGEKES